MQVFSFAIIAPELCCVAQAGTLFGDLADDHYAAEAVEALVADGVMSGYGNGSFGTNDPMTRAQLAKVVVDIRSRHINSCRFCGRLHRYAWWRS